MAEDKKPPAVKDVFIQVFENIECHGHDENGEEAELDFRPALFLSMAWDKGEQAPVLQVSLADADEKEQRICMFLVGPAIDALIVFLSQAMVDCLPQGSKPVMH